METELKRIQLLLLLIQSLINNFFHTIQSKEQRTKSKEQRTKSKEQRAKSKEQRTKSKEH